MNRLLTVSILLCQVLALAGVAAAENYTFLSQWGDQRPPLWLQLSKPRGVAVAANGNVYVSAVMQNQVFLYDSAKNILGFWNSCGPGALLNYPMEMAVDWNRSLYVADTGNNRVCVYTEDGVYQRRIEAGFQTPVGVAVDDSLNVYVADKGNNVVKKINISGVLVQTWGGFTSPWGVTVYNNNVYVTDGTLTGMVHKLDMNGTRIKSWGPRGTGNGQFLIAEGIAAYNGRLYVADGEYGRIHVFDLNGNWLQTFGERGTGSGQLQFSTALAVDAVNGWLYVSDDDNDRVMTFNLNATPPAYVTQWGCDASGATGLRYPAKIALDDAHGVMYVVDSGNHRIRKMTSYPNVNEVLSFGGYGNGTGQFRFPIDAAVDSTGSVYVVDNLKRNVQKFSSTGAYLRTYDFNAPPLLTAPPQYLYGLHAIAIDSSDNIYIVDAGTDTVQVIDALGNKISSWPVNAYPTGIALDEAGGFIYVTSFFPDVATQYDMGGTPTGTMIGQGDADPLKRLWHPFGAAVDGGGNIITADTFHNRLVKFGTAGAQGNFITSVGNLNWTGDAAAGQFTFPYGVSLDTAGFIYAADTNNHRIQIFRPDPFTFSTSSQGNGTIICSPTVNYGNQQACTITPSAGYYLSSLTDNGKSIAVALPGNVYTVTNVTSDHTISVTFRLIQTPPVRVRSGAAITHHDTVMLAYASPVSDDDVMELQPITYAGETPVFDRAVRFTLRGGVDFLLSGQAGHSIITGPLTVTGGTVTFDQIIIR